MTLRRLSRRVAPLMLGLAVWMALPSLEWCPFTWAECRESCDAQSEPVACEIAPSCDPICNATMSCGTALPDAECAAPTTETSDAASCPLPCDPTPDTGPAGDRAWCVHPPVEALVAVSIEIQPPAPAPTLALLAPSIDLEPPLAESARVVTTVFQPPILVAPHAPPLGRAPPSIEPGTRC